jgi:hypothetical protein
MVNKAHEHSHFPAIEIQNILEKGVFLKRQQGLNGEELIPGHLTLAFSSLCIHRGYNLTG